MITIKTLKKLIENLPDDAQVVAYEGEGCGLQVSDTKKWGWIETGFSATGKCNPKKHDLKDFG